MKKNSPQQKSQSNGIGYLCGLYFASQVAANGLSIAGEPSSVQTHRFDALLNYTFRSRTIMFLHKIR